MSNCNRKTTLEDFEDGLFEHHRMTLDEFKQKYNYAGGYCRCAKCQGDQEGNCANTRHTNYFSKKVIGFNERKHVFEVPSFKDNCVCGHSLSVCNCYMFTIDQNIVKFIIVGNCCVNHFLGDVKFRNCEICKAPHKNRNIDRCSDCRSKTMCRVKECSMWTDGSLCDIHVTYVRCVRCKNYCENVHAKTKKCSECVDKCATAECTKRVNGSNYLHCYTCSQSIKKDTSHPCEDCGKPCDNKYKCCYDCNHSTKCQTDGCFNKCRSKFTHCYVCNQQSKIESSENIPMR